MDRQISENEIRRQRWRKLLWPVLALLITVILLTGLRRLITPTLERSRILVSYAELGQIDDTITASGVLIPEREQVIISPIQSKIEQVFITTGEKIDSGVSVLALNKEFVNLQRDRLMEELELLANRKTQINLALERNRTELQVEYDIKKLSLELLQSKLNQAEHLYSIGAGSKDQLDQAQLNLKIAERELDLLARTMDNEEKTLSANLREVDLNIAIQRKSIAQIERQLELAQIRAERSGVVTWVNDNIGSSVSASEVVARITDLGSYKVQCQISDVHAGRLKLGQAVRIRINREDSPGEISAIEPTINNGIVTFFVNLADRSNPALRSNLRVDVHVITAFKENVVRVKYGPFVNGPGRQDIFVLEGDRALRRPVLIGATNLDFVEIITGVDPGTAVIISDMENYRHRNSIRIVSD